MIEFVCVITARKLFLAVAHRDVGIPAAVPVVAIGGAVQIVVLAILAFVIGRTAAVGDAFLAS